jgi:O-methyltransferase
MPPDLLSGLARALHAPVRKMFAAFGFDLQYFGRIPQRIPDRAAYQPRFRPWLLPEWQSRFAPTRGLTLVSDDRLYVLAMLLEQALQTCPGDIAECGVYRGGTARLLLDTMRTAQTARRLFLCDTFAGMPDADPAADLHREGDFGDTSQARVRAQFADADDVELVPGTIPDSLARLADRRFCFVHIDLDLYASVLGAARFLYDRVSPGGFIVFDDYGFSSTPGARRAVDEFFAGKRETPLALASGQCIVLRAPTA